MVVAREDVEQFLDRVTAEGASWDELEPGLWVIRPSGALDLEIVVNHAPPVLVLRVKVMNLPTDSGKLSSLMRQLLEWNAKDLLHGSYGIQENAIVLTAALEVSHLDYEEFRATYESMTLALAEHLRELSAYREAR